MDRNVSSGDPLGRLAVLVVDDHRINREWLHAGLRHRVARVVLAENGRAAIECCRRETFDVVLMDLNMPGMDGRATAVSIRDLAVASSRARLIAVTADARRSTRDRLLDSGFDACLSKPAGLDEVTAAIERLFGTAQSGVREDGGPAHAALVDSRDALRAGHGNAELVRRLQGMLAEELRTRRPELERALLQNDPDVAADLLHQWMGACGYAGAQRLASDCGSLHEALTGGARRARAQACVRLLRTAEATRNRLQHD